MVEEKRAAGQRKELLTAQEQAMWRVRHRDEMKPLGPEAKKEFLKKLRLDLEKMGPEELAKTKSALRAEWDALPAGRKEKIVQRLAEKKGQAGAE
jgi:hypothetical protein